MAKIAYLLLCHKNAERVLEQARVLTAMGDCIAIHMDANASAAFHRKVEKGIANNPHATLAKRVKCGWGEWSLVQATLNMIEAAHANFPDATHFFLMSGDCMPTKPAHHIHAMLDSADTDQIEHADFFEDDWIKTGMKEDRLIYRHWFNERRQKRLFYGSLALQRRLNLSRRIPPDLRMRIGSQWWVLRRTTIDKIREFLRDRADVTRFFRTTWIPDETFFQTLTMHLVPREQVISAPPTYLMFSDYGMPVTFCADHYDLLRTQGSFFARKISDHDDDLRNRLGALFISDEPVAETVDSGRALYDYVRRQGRSGRRFAPRVWEAGTSLGADRRVNVIICKKWHVAKRVLAELTAVSERPGYGFIFDEDNAGLPPLGNIESSRDKRARHRRAFLRLLFETNGARAMTFCLDPSGLDAIRDLATDGCDLNLLEIRCDISDDWLTGHAERIGLGSRSEAGALHAGLMSTLRINIEDESAALRALGLPGYRRINQGDAPGAMARPIADALGISIDAAGRIARRPDLFE